MFLITKSKTKKPIVVVEKRRKLTQAHIVLSVLKVINSMCIHKLAGVKSTNCVTLAMKLNFDKKQSHTPIIM